MGKFSGQCVIGPDDGKMLTHWARTKKYFRLAPGLENKRVKTIEIGEYRFRYGQWHWWPTKEGQAYDTLLEEDKG